MKEDKQERKDAVVLLHEEDYTGTALFPSGSAKTDSNSGKIRHNWDDFKRAIRAKYPRLSWEDVDSTNGRMEALIRKIQERYPEDLNFTREQIHDEIGDILARYG